MNAQANIFEVSIQNFQTDVVEKSRDLPVLLEFYADEAEQSREYAPMLAKLANDYAGKMALARVNIRDNPQLVQQLGVRTLPTLKVIFQGQMAQNLEGPLDDTQLREMLDQLTMSPVEMVRNHLDALLAEGNRGAAIQMLQQAIAEEPKNFALHAELADLMVMEDRIDDARQILAAVPPDTEGVEKPTNRIEFMELAAELPPVARLEQEVVDQPDDLNLRYQLAVRLVADDQIEAALEELLAMLKKDKTFDEELPRRTMIKVFELLGKGNETATSYRRKMFTFLH